MRASACLELLSLCGLHRRAAPLSVVLRVSRTHLMIAGIFCHNVGTFVEYRQGCRETSPRMYRFSPCAYIVLNLVVVVSVSKPSHSIVALVAIEGRFSRKTLLWILPRYTKFSITAVPQVVLEYSVLNLVVPRER